MQSHGLQVTIAPLADEAPFSRATSTGKSTGKRRGFATNDVLLGVGDLASMCSAVFSLCASCLTCCGACDSRPETAIYLVISKRQAMAAYAATEDLDPPPTLEEILAEQAAEQRDAGRLEAPLLSSEVAQNS